ncbi:MAG TPA: tetratricopeptide repeat protein [Anaeromyxobacteraceae bacterium]|nr:tetratricopeptide repeat protein [Anaeromyxobacteraceae bacterium]
MPKPPPPGGGPPGDVPPDDTLTTGFYEAPPEKQAEAPAKKPGLETMIDDALGDDTEPQWSDTFPTRVAEQEPSGPRQPRGRAWRKVVAVAAVAALAGGAAVAYRSQHRKQVLQQGLTRARELMVPDTFAGYRDAAQVLLPLVDIDPLGAGSVRAFALAMLHADYRDQKAGPEAEALLVAPDRAPLVPPAANLAHAALALARREAGTATAHASRPGGAAWGATIQGRLALLAGNPSGAVESLDRALAAEPQFPAALALRGDALRRLRRFEAARAAYADTLRASPGHARAAFGMAKLALGGQAKPQEALPALERLLADKAGTPSNERGRAALHLAALRGRLGDRPGAAAAVDAAGVEGGDRAWLEKAVAEEELSRTGYRAVAGAPAALQSASDDDPYQPAPPPVGPRKEAKAGKKAAKKVAKTSGKASSRKAVASKKKASKTASKTSARAGGKTTARKTGTASSKTTDATRAKARSSP